MFSLLFHNAKGITYFSKVIFKVKDLTCEVEVPPKRFIPGKKLCLDNGAMAVI